MKLAPSFRCGKGQGGEGGGREHLVRSDTAVQYSTKLYSTGDTYILIFFTKKKTHN